MTHSSPTVLWWSRSGRDYSRDRIIRNALTDLGVRIADFRPRISRFGDIEAAVRGIERPDAVWVPCFRQRDAGAAARWARRRDVPVIFDPLISAWDKQVFERQKFDSDSRAARRLLKQESRLFRRCDRLIADTRCHAQFFQQTHQADPNRISVIPVGAEEAIFRPKPMQERTGPLRVLFYGSFIGLQGPRHIAEASRLLPDVQWTFIGSGPLLDRCRDICANADHVEFISRVPYDSLSDRIAEADVLFGVFGTSEKAGRVIPNKVYQALACGRPVITRTSAAYPDDIVSRSASESGLTFVEPGCPESIAAAVREFAAAPDCLALCSDSAGATYRRWFSNRHVRDAVAEVLDGAGIRLTEQNRAA